MLHRSNMRVGHKTDEKGLLVLDCMSQIDPSVFGFSNGTNAKAGLGWLTSAEDQKQKALAGAQSWDHKVIAHHIDKLQMKQALEAIDKQNKSPIDVDATVHVPHPSTEANHHKKHGALITKAMYINYLKQESTSKAAAKQVHVDKKAAT